MTTLLPLSDLHVEFRPTEINSFVDSLPNSDIVSLAGDISTLNYLASTINLFCNKYKYVVYVRGNHEQYQSSFKEVDDLLFKLSSTYKNLYYLENQRVKIENFYFIGCTLWYSAHDPHWSDFYYIKDNYLINLKYEQSSQYLKNNVQEGDIVVTHMLPHRWFVDSKYVGNPYNCFFLSDISEVILNNKPKLWHCGHSHTAKDIMINNTRGVINAKGYPKEKGVGFNPNLIINL